MVPEDLEIWRTGHFTSSSSTFFHGSSEKGPKQVKRCKGSVVESGRWSVHERHKSHLVDLGL